MATIALYVGHGVLGVLDETFKRMHTAGGRSGSATGVTSPGSLLSSDGSKAVVQSWNDWWSNFQAVAYDGNGLSPSFIACIYLIADIVLISIPVSWLLARGSGALATAVNSGRPRGANDPSIQAFANLWAFTRRTAFAFVLFDIAEDALLIIAIHHPSSLCIRIVGGASVAKWLALTASFVSLLVGWAGSRNVTRPSPAIAPRRAWTVAFALRAQIIVIVVLVALSLMPGDIGRQIDDAILLLLERPWPAVWTGIAVVVLCAALHFTATQSLASYGIDYARRPGRSEPTPREPADASRPYKIFGSLLGVGLLLVGITAAVRRWDFGVALIVPGAIVLLWTGLSFGSKVSLFEPLHAGGQRLNPFATNLARGLAIAPIVVVGGLAVRDSVVLYIAGASGDALWLLFVGGLTGPVALGVVLSLLFARTHVLTGPPWLAPILCGAISAGIFGFGAWQSLTLGRWLGPWAVLLVFGMATLLALVALAQAGALLRPRGWQATIGLRQTPLVTGLVVCLIVSSFIDDGFRYHDARTRAASAPIQLQELEPALDSWLKRQDTTKPVQLVFIATAGGGIRAAYWTAVVMSCLAKPTEQSATMTSAPAMRNPLCQQGIFPKDSVFLESGISGGSLGLVMIRAVPDRSQWLAAAKSDFLGPNTAAEVFRDIPNSILRLSGPGLDRAAVLERAWEEAAAAHGGDLTKGFMEDAYTGSGDDRTLKFPILALNGSSVTDGCRVTVSPLDLADPLGSKPTDSSDSRPTSCVVATGSELAGQGSDIATLAGTKDVFDNTCIDGNAVPRDLSLSTAALLSARFPFVSPSGKLTSCVPGGGRTFDVDGGLVESSGAGPIALMAPAIKTWIANQKGVCIAPKLVLLDNGYANRAKVSPPKRPPELRVPTDAKSAVYNARSAVARQAAELAFAKYLPTPVCASGGSTQAARNVVMMYPEVHPGVEAPLGWTLSSYSRESLERQFNNEHNQCSLVIIASWFTPQQMTQRCSADL